MVRKTTCRVGTDMLAVANALELPGHGDSMSYVANVYILNDGKWTLIAKVHNSGWGGETDIYPEEGCNDIIFRLKGELNKHSWLGWKDHWIKYDLPFLIDMMADSLFDGKDTYVLEN